MRRRPCRLRDNRILRRPLGPHNTFAERVAPTGHTRPAAGLPGCVGHSWSGGLALAYALELSDGTRAIVLLRATFDREPATVTGLLRLFGAPVVGPLVAHTIMPLSGRSAFRRTVPDPVPSAGRVIWKISQVSAQDAY